MEGGVLRPLRLSQIYRPDVIEDIQVKAELGRYRIPRLRHAAAAAPGPPSTT